MFDSRQASSGAYVSDVSSVMPDRKRGRIARIVGMAMLAIGLVATGAYFVMAGKAIGIDGMPGPEYLGYLACAWVGGGAVVAVQLVVSLVIRNFALPVGIALAGGITGLLVEFKVKAVVNILCINVIVNPVQVGRQQTHQLA